MELHKYPQCSYNKYNGMAICIVRAAEFVYTSEHKMLKSSDTYIHRATITMIFTIKMPSHVININKGWRA